MNQMDNFSIDEELLSNAIEDIREHMDADICAGAYGVEIYTPKFKCLAERRNWVRSLREHPDTPSRIKKYHNDVRMPW